MRRQIEMIDFVDMDSNAEGFAIVSVIDDVIGLTTSTFESGECEAYMTIDVCKQLRDALSKAIAAAEQA